MSVGCKFAIENVVSSNKIENVDCFEHQIMQIYCVDETPDINSQLNIDPIKRLIKTAQK